MIGWADEVIGEMERRLGGRVSLFGKRMGEVNGLDIVSVNEHSVIQGYDVRVVETRYFRHFVHNVVCGWPREVCRIIRRSLLQVLW